MYTTFAIVLNIKHCQSSHLICYECLEKFCPSVTFLIQTSRLFIRLISVMVSIFFDPVDIGQLLCLEILMEVSWESPSLIEPTSRWKGAVFQPQDLGWFSDLISILFIVGHRRAITLVFILYPFGTVNRHWCEMIFSRRSSVQMRWFSMFAESGPNPHNNSVGILFLALRIVVWHIE